MQVDRVTPVAITALVYEGSTMATNDRRMTNQKGRRESDFFDAERCKKQADYCEKMNQARDKRIDYHNVALHQKIDTVKTDLTGYISDVKEDLTASIESVKTDAKCDNNKLDKKFWAIVVLCLTQLIAFAAGTGYIIIQRMILI